MPCRNAAHEAALENGRLFYEARIIHQDSSIHWIRVSGHYYFAKGGVVRVLGTILDITEVKKLQYQKDDFIGIASDELKTPKKIPFYLIVTIVLIIWIKAMPALG